MEKRPIMEKNKCKVLLLYLLKQIDKACTIGGIRYYAYAGTILGAVRNKGMIPWDDDIDIVIERKDYNNFVNECTKIFKEPIIVHTRENDKKFCAEYIKVSYKDDTEIFSEISIDVFILDETNPSNKILRWIQKQIILMLYYVKHFKVSKDKGIIKFKYKKLVKYSILTLLSTLPYSFIDYILNVSMKIHGRNPSAFTIWGSHYNYNKVTFDKSYWRGLKYLPFENTQIPVPDKYIDILIKMYGQNYMIPPPENKRENHCVHEIICKNLDYNKIVKEINYGK